MDTRNLKLRHRTWYARLRVPPSLRSAMGKSELVRSLNTRDLAEANRRKHAVLAEMQAQISKAEVNARLPKDAAERVLNAAQELAEAVKGGETTLEEAEVALDATLEDHLEAQSRKYGRDEEGHPKIPEAHERTLRRAMKVLCGGDLGWFSTSIKTYIEEKAPHINNQTRVEKQRQLEELVEWLGGDCEVTTVTKKVAGRYVTEYLHKKRTKTGKPYSPKTIKDTLSNLSAFWRWLEGRGLVEFNVWQGMGSTVRGSTKVSTPIEF
jgi:hypothetical protein